MIRIGLYEANEEVGMMAGGHVETHQGVGSKSSLFNRFAP